MLTNLDNEAQTVPTGLQIVGVNESSISITWNPSSDNVKVGGYKIFVNRKINDSTISSTYISTGLQMSTTYSATVSAFDETGDESTQFLEPANLRIANLSGQVVYSQKIAGSDTLFPSEIQLDLTNQLNSLIST